MFGFVLVPERNILLDCVRMSESLVGSSVCLDDSFRLPHVTVLQAPIVGSFDWRGALREFRDFAGFVHEPRSFVGETVWVDNFVFLGVRNVGWLSEFNRLIVGKVSSFIDVPVLPDVAEGWSSVERDSFLKTGYKHNLDAFFPHVTLGRFSDELKSGVVLPVSGLLGKRFRFKSLAYVEHGEFGTVKRVLGEELLPFSWA